MSGNRINYLVGLTLDYDISVVTAGCQVTSKKANEKFGCYAAVLSLDERKS